MTFFQILLCYLAIINAAAFFICGWDKHLAKKQARRVPEKTLLLFCVLGGSPVFWIAMQVFHHKTRKPKFYLGVPAILICQLVATWFIWSRFMTM